MITAVYERELYRLTAVGHAESAPYGQDLVCAGVSVLLLTAQRMARRLERDGAAVCQSRVVRGCGSVQCLPKADCEAHVRAVLDTIAGGLELLSEECPDSVCYEERS